MPLEDFQQGCFDISKQVAPQKEIAVCRDWTREVVIVFWVSFCESFSKWIFVLTLNIHVIDIFVDWFVKKKLKENSFFLRRGCCTKPIVPFLVMTKTMDVAPMSACEHSKNSMFCLGPCEACKTRLAAVEENRPNDNESAAKINQSKHSGRCLEVPQLPDHPEHHVHWSDEDEGINSSHELETRIEPVKSPVTSSREDVHVKPILKHKPTCVVVVHVDAK